MSKVWTAAVLGLATILPGAMGASALASSTAYAAQQQTNRPPPPAHGPCEKVSYSGGVWVKTKIPNCSVVPPNHHVHMPMCGLNGWGTAMPDTAITFQCLPLLVKLCQGETGTSFAIAGSDLDLAGFGGHVYRFNPATGQSQLVAGVTGSGGQFTVVFGSCASVGLPATGGAAPLAPNGPSLPTLPIGLGVLMVLVGGALTLRTRKSQV